MRQIASCDIVVSGGQVIDGTGRPRFAADVGVDDDRIIAVGDLSGVHAGRTIDATGRVVAPGFIDVHAHDDLAVRLDPDIAFKVRQGVTTDVVGNCGFGAAPCRTARRAFAGWHEDADQLADWDGYAGYMAAIDADPPALNVGVLIGHGTVRGDVLAGHADQLPNDRELARMAAVVEEGMAAGALGLSTGLIYEPGRHAATDEIVALAAVVASARGIYTSHLRNEAERLLDAVAEAIAIGERAGVAVQLSHHKASGEQNWGTIHQSMAMVDDARRRGLAIAMDQYPYTAGSTNLAAVVGNGALDGGGGGMGAIGAEAVRICSAPGHPEWEGLRLPEVGQLLGMSGREAADHVVATAGLGAVVTVDIMCEEDVRAVLANPLTMIGSDGVPAGSRPHPRLYGTFPRVLGHYAREVGLLDLEEAVRRMTALPADTFDITGRGAIATGNYADVVVFDADKVTDTATFDDPCQFPIGIDMVMVNGRVVVDHGEPTGARPGRALRRGP